MEKKGINWNKILPETVNNKYEGQKIAQYGFLLITIITIIRSCIHIFAPDGGAGTIAGLDTTVTGGENLISIFSIWGLSQLVLGLFYLIIYLRYKTLIPLGYISLIIEYAGRWIIGQFKPLIASHTIPGAIGNYIMVPVAIFLLILSLWSKKLPENGVNN